MSLNYNDVRHPYLPAIILYDKDGNNLPSDLKEDFFAYDPHQAYEYARDYRLVPDYSVPPLSYDDLVQIAHYPPSTTLEQWLSLRAKTYNQLIPLAPEYKMVYGANGNYSDLFFYLTHKNSVKIDNKLVRARNFPTYSAATRKLLGLLHAPQYQSKDAINEGNIVHKNYAMGDTTMLSNKWEPVIAEYERNIGNDRHLVLMPMVYNLYIPDLNGSEKISIAEIVFLGLYDAIVNDPLNLNPPIN